MLNSYDNVTKKILKNEDGKQKKNSLLWYHTKKKKKKRLKFLFSLSGNIKMTLANNSTTQLKFQV